ncbi:PREDICTED: protein eva-1 isoform X3 [Polistes canadensis]|uniref:protein eva-1 isoform X3 n=1 Tax=Polistes canadensis TaxID=91411 RepID=UPI000718D4F5|nr:PREDICTED: protein eva-1 isoform X3 [Polistes canadensis]
MSLFTVMLTTTLLLLLFLLHGPTLVLTDNLALLSSTLKTYQRGSCDEETMTLKCPPGTTVSVALAHYGRASESGTQNCGIPSSSSSSSIKHSSKHSSKFSSNFAIDQNQQNNDQNQQNNDQNQQNNDTCLLPSSLQYSLLQTVVEMCRNKRQCKFNTSPKTFQGDPCPGLRKYVEVAYKCSPYEFRRKVVCENDVVNLTCHPGQRVAILRASFGKPEYESFQCPQPHGLKNDTCTATYATETVIQMCHGKRHCSIVANSTTFNDPCRPEIKTYFEVVYTCVQRWILREQYQSDLESDEMNLTHKNDEGFDRVDFRAEFSPSPNLEGPQPQPRDNVSRNNFPTVSSSPPRARTNNDDNQEKFYLYIIVSVSGGVLVFLGLVIGKLLLSRHRAKRDAKFHANNEALPNAFTDNISEVDANIDLTTPVPVPMQDTRIPETQLAERLHGSERYYTDTRIPLSPNSIHTAPIHHATSTTTTGVRVDLGNHMVGTDSLHTILRTENPRSLNTKSYYYG